MQDNVINLIKNVSLETLAIGFIVFLITMLVKYPIKKLTSKLKEEKRKALNSVIILISIFISVIVSFIYHGFSTTTIECSFSSWIISFSIYSIYERIVILIKGILSGKINQQESKQIINTINNSLNTLNSQLKIDEKQLETITNKISSLIKIRNAIGTTNLMKLSETNIEIKNLTDEETKLKNNINETKNQIDNCKNELLKMKGE